MPLVHTHHIRHSSPQRLGPSLYSQLCGSPAQLTDRPAAKLVLTMYMSGEPQNTYLSTISCHLLFLHYIWPTWPSEPGNGPLKRAVEAGKPHKLTYMTPTPSTSTDTAQTQWLRKGHFRFRPCSYFRVEQGGLKCRDLRIRSHDSEGSQR